MEMGFELCDTHLILGFWFFFVFVFLFFFVFFLVFFSFFFLVFLALGLGASKGGLKQAWSFGVEYLGGGISGTG